MSRKRIIAVGAHKGGVGKTTISVLLASGLANDGHRVVIVDLDAQAQVADWLGMPHAPALHRMLVEDAAARDQLVAVPRERWCAGGEGELFVIPGDRTNQTVWRKTDDLLRLRHKLLELLEQEADYIILDTPPAISEEAVSYLLTAGRIVIPTKTSYLTVRGVLNTLETVKLLREKTRRMPGGGVDIEVIGILPNLYNSRRSLHRQNLKALRVQFGDVVWPVLNDYAAFEEAPQAHQSIFVYAPGVDVAERARARAARIMHVFKKTIGAEHDEPVFAE